MDHAFRSAVSGWTDFYVIIGSGSAALTGLMFVVVTLIAGSERRGSGQTVAAFGSPTVVHFVAPLVIAATLTAPWPHLSELAWVLAWLGAGGVVYGISVIWIARKQNEYRAEISDWIWFQIAPPVIDAGVVVCAALLHGHLEGALFGIGAAALLLLLIAIRNAWDTVTFLAVDGNPSN